MISSLGCLTSCLLVALLPVAQVGAHTSRYVVHPTSIELDGPASRQQLVVFEQSVHGQLRDVTREIRIANPDAVVALDARGGLVPKRDGKAQVDFRLRDTKLMVPVQVTGIATHKPVDFAREIEPILTKSGCNQGACHGSQHGKGGFRLSLLGFDPSFDHAQIVHSAEGRRVFVSNPERSLLLQKPSLKMPHGGGERLGVSTSSYETLLRWIDEGVPEPPAVVVQAARLEVFPTHRIMIEGEVQQLQVHATWSDGKAEDVTHLVQYDSLGESVALVSRDGLVTAKGRGETHIMMRFAGQVAVSRVTLPYASSQPTHTFVAANFIDEHLQAKWRDLGLAPSGPASDADFFRRLHLDTIGTLPSPADVKAFLADAHPDKRKTAIDRVLDRPEFIDFWTLKWGDLLRINRDQLEEKGMWSFHNWVRASIRDNKPLDEFAREIITAEGSTFTSGPANFYRTSNDPNEWAETTTQLFLGVRIQCAKCHHHPFEKWSQDDYYGMSAFFARLTRKNSQEFGIFGRETVIHPRPTGEVSHPRKGGVVKPHALDGPNVDDSTDRRQKLVEWMTDAQNPFFARNLANRFWGYFFGRGLVEPLDDMRGTNPATNSALLDALARDLVEHRFDLKHMMRTMLMSRAYQLSSTATAENARDTQNLFHARYTIKRLTAEQIADGVDQVTGTREKYQGLPLGTRAIQLPDTSVRSFMLDVFGRPPRQITCECERKAEPNIAQALHLLNGDSLTRKLTAPTSTLEQLLKAKSPPKVIVEELYLATLSRPPSEAEQTKAIAWIGQAPTVREGAQDLLWVLLNSREFLFVH